VKNHPEIFPQKSRSWKFKINFESLEEKFLDIKSQLFFLVNLSPAKKKKKKFEKVKKFEFFFDFCLEKLFGFSGLTSRHRYFCYWLNCWVHFPNHLA
jgi:hypothetical protein